jgi:acyl-coenzyme A thioesterase PaaI-like protein
MASAQPNATNEDVTYSESLNLNPTGPGTYSARVPVAWSNGIGAAHGGWLLSLNLKAVLAEVAAQNANLSHPISVNSQYLSPAHPKDGLMSITAKVLRIGKRFAFAQSTTINGRGEIALVSSFCIGETVRAPGVPASIMDFGPQLAIESMRMPEMIPPEECVDFGDVFMKGR